MSARLVTIPFSHYCEKARWALDRAGVGYVEEGFAPGFHRRPARRAGGGHSVPVFVAASGAVVPDSTDILRWCDAHGRAPSPLWPVDPTAAAAVSELEERFDRRLGPATRRIGYGCLIDEPSLPRRILEVGPAWQRRMPGFVGRGLVALIRRGLKIDAAGIARSRAVLAEELADVAARLADGRRYLVGDAFSAADLTFASLLAPLIWPDAYARWLGGLDAAPAAMRALVAETRATPAGAFALRLYAEHR